MKLKRVNYDLEFFYSKFNHWLMIMQHLPRTVLIRAMGYRLNVIRSKLIIDRDIVWISS